MTTVAPATTSSARRRYDLDGIADVAMAVFAERGYAGTSMDEVARAAGIAKASLYHHVASKEELLERALDRAIAKILELEPALVGNGASATEQLHRIVRGIVQLAVEGAPHLALLRRLPLMGSTAPRALERYRAYESYAIGYVERAIAEGGLREDVDAVLLNRLMWLTTTAIADAAALDPSLDVDELVRVGSSVLFDGVAARP